MPDQPFKPTIFLDTNVLHNITSYLILAKKYNLRPYNLVGDYQNIKTFLNEHGLPSSLVGGLMSGLRTLVYLQAQIEGDEALIYSSRLTIAELWNGCLEGQAHIRMAIEGIPFRRRQKPSVIAELVRHRLTQEDYALVTVELNGFQEEWKTDFGIEILLAEDSSYRDISLLALEIQKVTFLDVVDCALFASSLAILATSYITSDEDLCKLINQINHPEQIPDTTERELWLAAQNSILTGMKSVLLNEDIDPSCLVQPILPRSLSTDISRLHILQ